MSLEYTYSNKRALPGTFSIILACRVYTTKYYFIININGAKSYVFNLDPTKVITLCTVQMTVTLGSKWDCADTVPR